MATSNDNSESPAPDGPAGYKWVRGLSRGLSLLRVLNRVDGGASITALALATDLHRTTVRRLLETLQQEGYVQRSPSDDSYHLTVRVRELSEGFRDEDWISSVSAPLLARLLDEVLWPTDICTLDVDAMVVRETTHRFSRLSFHRSMVGRRLPLLHTAIGLAYLAFCPVPEREQLIALLAGRSDPEFALARDRDTLDLLLERTRHQGYGANYMRWSSERKVAAIAVPIRVGDTLLGCINLVYLARAMSTAQAAQRYLPAMQRTAREIETTVLQRRARQPGMT